MNTQWNNESFQKAAESRKAHIEQAFTPEELHEILAQVAEGGSDPDIIHIDEWQLHCGALCNYLRMAGIDVTPILQSLVDQLPTVPGMPDMRSPKPRRRKPSQ